MRRIYLDKNGKERLPTLEEKSHYGMALTILRGIDPQWTGDTEDAYAAMWKLGWIRIVDYGEKLYAEQYRGGNPVDWRQLPRAQREWLEDQKLLGKEVRWNDALFESSREGRSGQVDAVVRTLLNR